MKKIISCFLILLLTATGLSSCAWNFLTVTSEVEYDDISKISGITRFDYENYTVFKFDDFEGRAVLKMNRVSIEKGKIYYQYNLTKGHVYANVDQGIYDSEQGLFFAVAGTKIPENSSSLFSIESNEIAIIFFTQGINMNNSTKVSGEIRISFIPFEEIE